MSTATLSTAGTTASTTGSTETGRPKHAVHPVLRIVRLHFADRFQMLAVPVIILTVVAAVCVGIFLLLTAFTPVPPEELAEGFRYNQAAVWSWPGFIVTLGVYAYARTMPFAIGMMGSTRQHYWAGTALWTLVQSVYLGAVFGAFLLLEQVTGHWFTGARMFDVYVLGDGNLGDVLLIGSGISFAALSAGAGLAAVYLRWGQYGVMAGIAGLLVLILGVLAVVLATGAGLMTFLSTGVILKVFGLLVLIAVIAHLVTWLVVRRVPVGR
ncbi:hypothetical protein [Citricoccus sp. GCM10030269]|uniref:hypothetical protein n=1 Tax=Citricoccus sp. GCM10030269 TaxID=3273388 RepID=UPI0036072E06